VGTWVGKKIAEALGAEEKDFADYLMSLLRAHAGLEKVGWVGRVAVAVGLG